MTVRLKLAHGLAAVILVLGCAAHAQSGPVLTGRDALGDWTTDKPGVTRRVTLGDMPEAVPGQTVKVFPNVVDIPANTQPQVPPGFTVKPYGDVLEGPRALTVAPNGAFAASPSRT